MRTARDVTQAERERALDMWAAGEGRAKISAALDIPHKVLEGFLKIARKNNDPRAARRRGTGVVSQWAERVAREEARYRDIPVPTWVERAGIRDLDLRYLAIAETRGVKAAAAHCRNLLASRRPAGAERRDDCARASAFAPHPDSHKLAMSAQPAQRVLSRGAP